MAYPLDTAVSRRVMLVKSQAFWGTTRYDSTSWLLARMLILPPHKPVACMSHLVLGWATMNWGHALAYGLHSHVYLGAVGSYAPYRIVWCHLEGGSNFCGFHPFLQPLISLGPKHQVPLKTSHWPILVRVGEQGNRRAFLVTGTVITVGFEPRTLHLPGRKGISRFTRSIRHGFRVKVWMISIGLQGS